VNLPRTPLLALLCSLRISCACTHLPGYSPAILCALVVTYDLYLCIRYYRYPINIYLSSSHNHLCLYTYSILPRHHYFSTSLAFSSFLIPSLSSTPSTTMSKRPNQSGGMKRVPSTPVPASAKKEATPLQPGPAGTSTSTSTSADNPKFYVCLSPRPKGMPLMI